MTAVVERWSAEQVLARSAELWAVYEPVFGDQPSRAAWVESALRRHTARDGFRLVAAVVDGQVVGFGYGYLGDRGQYWPDRVVEALPDDVAQAWVGGHFELVTIGVLADHRGEGLGGRLHDALLDGVASDRALLGTDADETPAVSLYRARGWTNLGLLEPGVQVMGLTLRR